MTTHPPTLSVRDDRFDELRAAYALDDMSPAESEELANLLADEHDDDSFDRAAVCVFLAHEASTGSAPMPESVSKMLAATAVGWCAARTTGLGAAAEADRVRHTQPDSDPTERFRHRRRWRVPTALAAMAFVLAALLAAVWPAVWGGGGGDFVVERAGLVNSAADLVRWQWSGWDNPAMDGVSGDVVWSDDRQRGYLSLKGLPANDPTVEQYQLWIVDARRGLGARFSGGVFNVSGSGEVVVPIRSELKVDRPQLFAVTVEKPGGTGISDMTRRAVLAKRPG